MYLLVVNKDEEEEEERPVMAGMMEVPFATIVDKGKKVPIGGETCCGRSEPSGSWRWQGVLVRRGPLSTIAAT